MKKIVYLALAAVLAMSMLAMSGCSKSEFGVTENTEKAMTIEAKKASVDSMFMVGTLEVAEGDQIVVTSDLENGRVKIEIIPGADDQSVDELPDMDVEAVMTGEIVAGGGMSGTMDPGSYYVKATVLEKADGTIRLDVIPAE